MYRRYTMNAQDILNFRKSLTDMSLEDLENMKKEFNNQINLMILNSDLIIKVAVVKEAIQAKKGESDGEVK